jgi:hypothetical protein
MVAPLSSYNVTLKDAVSTVGLDKTNRCAVLARLTTNVSDAIDPSYTLTVVENTPPLDVLITTASDVVNVYVFEPALEVKDV